MKIIGHRGASAVLPENTLAALARAWDVGADGIELDVRLSSDGEVVVFHDEDGKRLAGIPDPVASTPYSALVEWRIRGEAVPRLVDVLSASPLYSLTLVEIKCGEDILPRLQAIISKHHDKPVGFLTFNPDLAAKLGQFFPRHPVLLNLEPSEIKRLGIWVNYAVQNSVTGLSIGWSEGIDPAAIRLMHQHELLAAVWTVNDPASVRRAQVCGVDLLMTDDPGAMILQVHSG